MSSRGEFVKGSALAATGCLLPASVAKEVDAAGAAAKSTQPQNDADNWYNRPMRWAQLAFVEDDPGNYDKQFWLDYFRNVHADAACLSAGGVVAFYPTQIPLQQRSAWLGDRDTFGDLMAGCRAMGMNVVARTDSHACWQKVYDAHPDWIRVDANGQPVRHPSDPRYWETCALGPYNFEFMTAVHEEIMRMYKPDGIPPTAGRVAHVLLRTLPAEFPCRLRVGAAAHQRSAGPGEKAVYCLAAAAIHWQALRLFFKKVPVFTHPRTGQAAPPRRPSSARVA